MYVVLQRATVGQRVEWMDDDVTVTDDDHVNVL